MKKIFLFILSMGTLGAADPIGLSLGSNLEYTRFHQNCLKAQKGFLAGPSFIFDLTYPWRPYAGLFFDGLWDVANLCSSDGIFIKSNQYDTMLKFGFNFSSESARIMVTPYLGLGYLHMGHEIKDDIVKYRYHNVYVPVGVRFLHEIGETFSWELLVHYRADAWTRLKVSTPCVTTTKNCKIELKRTNGVHIAAPLTWTYGEDRRVSFTTKFIPTFDWQKFDTVKDCCDEGLTLPIPTLKNWKLGAKTMIGITF